MINIVNFSFFTVRDMKSLYGIILEQVTLYG